MKNTIDTAYLKMSIRFFALAVIIISLLLLYMTKNSEFAHINLLILTTGIFVLFLSRMNINLKVKCISLAIFLLKVSALFIFSMSNDILLFPDSHNYLSNLDEIIQMGDFSFQGIYSITWTLHLGHYYYMLVPYMLFESAESIMITNTLLVSIAIVLFYKVTDVEFGKKISTFVFIFSSFSLNLVLFGSFILKDSVVLFLSAMILYSLKVKKHPIYVPILVSVLLFSVRIYTGFAFLLAIIINILTDKETKKSFKLFTLSVAMIFFFLVSLIPATSNYINLSVAYISQNINIGTILASVGALAKFFFAPLPWNVLFDHSVYTVLLFDSLLFMILSFALILFVSKFIKSKILRNKLWIYLIPIFVHAVVLTAEYGGDSTRQRVGIFMFLILIYGIGLFYKKERHTQ